MTADCLSILHLEDDPRDAALVTSQLSREGLACDVTRVDGADPYERALRRGRFDVILAERAVRDLDARSALALARQLAPGVPVVCVSDAFGAESVVEMLELGAAGYVLKDRLGRLASVVRRVVAERAECRRAEEAERAVAALQEQLRHAQKLEVVGRLAGGVAHDFNNLLTIINGSCERLLAVTDEDGPLRPDIDLIRQSGLRAASLARQLLAVGRRQALERRRLDLNQIVADLGRMLERVIGQRTTVVTTLSPALGAVEGDRGQIEQVLMNLVINARDAMPDGGTLTIETRNVEVEPGAIDGATPLVPGSYVQLSVTDTGHGMDEATAAHAFEPFFTTKAAGEGTGLGLSTVYGIVVQSGGQVWLDSRPGAGTTVRVVLPRADAARAATPAPSVVADAGHETLLVVEDEAFVRELVRDFLAGAGYHVLEAASAEDAMRVAAATTTPIDLLLTDLMLPGMNGTQLAAALRERMPGMSTLYMSGYPGDSLFGTESFEPDAAFLPKPFTRQLLTSKVRDVLDAGAMADAVR